MLSLPSSAAFAFVRHSPQDVVETVATSRRIDLAMRGSFSKLVVDYLVIRDWLTVVVLREEEDAKTTAFSQLRWGAVIGDKGTASEAEVASAIAHPRSARWLLGRFAAFTVAGETVEGIVGPEIGQVLKTSASDHRDVISTSGLLARILSGGSVEVAPDRVGEFLSFDCVLGDDELLQGVSIISEASKVLLSRAAISVSSYWDVSDRLREDQPPRPSDLWNHLQETTARIFADDEARLGLTSGRDSTLLASVAASISAELACFTFGDADYWDVHGAKAICESLGWHHSNVWRIAPVPISMRKVTSFSGWTDGLETARNLYGAPWSPTFHDAVFVSGHGGEIGRAFYWKDAADIASFGSTLATSAARVVPEPFRSATRERVLDELAKYAHLPREAALDAFYARNRTRNWTGRGIRRTNFSGGVMGFGDPVTVAMLLNVPVAQKRDSSFFDEVIALDPKRLRAVARAAAAEPWRRAASAHKSSTSRFEAFKSPAFRDPLRLGGDLQLRDSLLRETFGRKWLSSLLRRASRPTDSEARRVLWNAISVEGLHRLLQSL